VVSAFSVRPPFFKFHFLLFMVFFFCQLALHFFFFPPVCPAIQRLGRAVSLLGERPRLIFPVFREIGAVTPLMSLPFPWGRKWRYNCASRIAPSHLFFSHLTCLVPLMLAHRNGDGGANLFFPVSTLSVFRPFVLLLDPLIHVDPWSG